MQDCFKKHPEQFAQYSALNPEDDEDEDEDEDMEQVQPNVATNKPEAQNSTLSSPQESSVVEKQETRSNTIQDSKEEVSSASSQN